MKYRSVIILLFFLTNCKPISDKIIDKNNPKFNTTEDSELFFKNVRQVAYDLERQDHTKLDIYRHKKRSNSTKNPIINLAIAHNWRYDEVYILIELGGFFKNNSVLKIEWKNEQSGEVGIYEFERKSNKNEYFRFATEIYNSIIAQHTLWIIKNDKKIPFLINKEEKEVFRTTMKDYYRLVALI